jgi:4-carboxymuconolactone decarboxylase
MKSDAYKAGLEMRRKVLGADYVDANIKTADELTEPFQNLLTEFAWGSVWTREGLTLRERSLLTVAMCVAMNRPAELRIHLRGAFRNGCTKLEIRELLLQAFIYAGGPAAVDAFRVTKEFLADNDGKELAGASQA